MATSAEPGRKAPYSNDLRWRIVWQRFGMELSLRKIAENLNVALGTTYNDANYLKIQDPLIVHQYTMKTKIFLMIDRNCGSWDCWWTIPAFT